jgi:hypothetical protein
MGFARWTGVRMIWLIPVLAVAVLALIELPALAGLVDYRHVIGAVPLRLNYIDDPELGYIHRPSSRLSGSSNGGYASMVYDLPVSDLTQYRWDTTYDRKGFRNKTDLTSADIVVLGDSIVEGTEGGITDAQLMTTLLAQQSGKVVSNLGHNTYGPQQELIILKRYGLSLHPRTVIWVFSETSDVGDAAHYPVIRRRAANPWLAFVERSFTKNALKQLRPSARKQPAANGLGVVRTANGTLNTYFTPPDVLSAQPLGGMELSALDEIARTLKSAASLCAQHGCHVVFVYAPDKLRVLHDICTFSPEFLYQDRRLNDVPDRLARVAASLSPPMEYLDLTPALIDDVKQGRMPYDTDDYHWNEEGQRVAAAAVGDYISVHETGSAGESSRSTK